MFVRTVRPKCQWWCLSSRLVRTCWRLRVRNAAGRTKIERKSRALARRLARRQDDYLRFARDFSVPFDTNAPEREIRMSELRITVS